jgi:hypothetical protein
VTEPTCSVITGRLCLYSFALFSSPVVFSPLSSSDGTPDRICLLHVGTEPGAIHDAQDQQPAVAVRLPLQRHDHGVGRAHGSYAVLGRPHTRSERGVPQRVSRQGEPVWLLTVWCNVLCDVVLCYALAYLALVLQLHSGGTMFYDFVLVHCLESWTRHAPRWTHDTQNATPPAPCTNAACMGELLHCSPVIWYIRVQFSEHCTVHSMVHIL